MDVVEKLGVEDFKQLRDFIYEQSGLFFSDAKLYFIENRLSKRLQHFNFTRYQEYLKYLKNPANRKELLNLFDLVTTNETSFYRNPPQIEAFADNILPKVIKNLRDRGQRTLKIWSAACSSGEEPFTIAMVLEEKKDLLQGIVPRVYATDISHEILEKANAGIYQAYTMRNLTPQQKNNFFVKHGNDFKVTNAMQNLVTFSFFNLVDYPGFAKFRGMDIIFCRNVLIYFDLKVKREIIKNYYQSLNKDGYLLIGHSESLHNVNKDFKLEHFSRALAYYKDK